MTDTEINTALALAIGYTSDRVRSVHGWVQVSNDDSRRDGPMPYNSWQRFDHTDPKTIWPIAEKYDCFPRRSSDMHTDWWTVELYGQYSDANSAAKAVALAVIQMHKDTTK